METSPFTDLKTTTQSNSEAIRNGSPPSPGNPSTSTKTSIASFPPQKTILSDSGMQMTEPAKDLSETIPNASRRYSGAAVIKFIVVPKTKKYTALMEKEIF